MTWWLWILIGFAFLAVELLTPGGFFALFFGVGALLTGLLVASNLISAGWLQWVVFSLVSFSTMLAFRKPLRGWLRQVPAVPVDSLVGEWGVLLDDVPTQGRGRIEVRGSPWSARSNSPKPLKRGTRCQVERVEGLTLWVRPENPVSQEVG